MKPSLVTLSIVTGIILVAIVVGRSNTIQDSLLLADGYEVLVENPQKVLVAQPDSEVAVDFQFKNISDKTIRIVGLNTGCGCTVAQNIPCSIVPHKTENVRLLVSTLGDKSGEAIHLYPEYYLSRPSRKMKLSIQVDIK